MHQSAQKQDFYPHYKNLFMLPVKSAKSFLQKTALIKLIKPFIDNTIVAEGLY